MIAIWINGLNEGLWAFFLPLLILLGLFINLNMVKGRAKISDADISSWQFSKIKGALSISLASKVGTGAIIGVLAAMWQGSVHGGSGEGIVFWVLVGMLFLVPITYSEVLFTQICKQTHRDFIKTNLNAKAATVYALGLVALYAFGFVGFQLTGVQTVVRYFSENYLDYQFNSVTALFYIVVPIILLAGMVIITKSRHLFINTLSSLIFIIILAYLCFFLLFVYQTRDFISQYFTNIYDDVMNFHSAGIGIPIGLIIAFQRIIQISETSLGTSALSSSDGENSPRREAFVQTISTLISIAIAVIITSYVFAYGQAHIEGVALVGDSFERVKGYIFTVFQVTGYFGLSIVLLFFVVSGFTTILGSFHYVNTCLNISEKGRIIAYLFLISLSGALSVTHFDIIFEASNLLMFIVGAINLLAMAFFIHKKIHIFHLIKNKGSL
ncbi:MAG: Na+/alanine symporter [Psychromonas sp.]|jgi:Na+/alanine symporter|uniref:alanine:cation symporter family protein n=1 Tax=Psychromonas sp. TaxID=1884585 RepID=UPI0039E3E17E